MLKIRVEVAKELRTSVKVLERGDADDPGHLMVLLILRHFFSAPLSQMRRYLREVSAATLAEKFRFAQEYDADFILQYEKICEVLRSVTPEILPSWADASQFGKSYEIDMSPISMIRDERAPAFRSSPRFYRDSGNRLRNGE